MDNNQLVKNLRKVLREYENGTDSAACMVAIASMVELLLEDHEALREDLFHLEGQLMSRPDDYDDWRFV